MARKKRLKKRSKARVRPSAGRPTIPPDPVAEAYREMGRRLDDPVKSLEQARIDLFRRLCEKWEAEEEEARVQDRPFQIPDETITVITEEEQLNELRRYYREPLLALKEQGARDKRLDSSRRLIQRVREQALGGRQPVFRRASARHCR